MLFRALKVNNDGNTEHHKQIHLQEYSVDKLED